MAAIISAFQSWQRFEQQNPCLAVGIKQATAEAVQNAIENTREANARQKANERYEIYRLQQERLQLEADKIAAIEAAKRAQEEAKRTEILLGQQFDRCLSSNFHCRENAHGFPRRCNSPASRYAAVNEAATDQKVAAFKKRKEVARSQQFRMFI